MDKKWPKMVKNVENGGKWLKMDKKWPKMVKNVENGGKMEEKWLK
jgi:hypothetical protein